MCGVLVCGSFSPGLRIAVSQALLRAGLQRDMPFSATSGQSLLALPGHHGTQALSPSALPSMGSAVTWWNSRMPAGPRKVLLSCKFVPPGPVPATMSCQSQWAVGWGRQAPSPAARALAFLGSSAASAWLPGSLPVSGRGTGGPCCFPPGAARLRAPLRLPPVSEVQ